MATIFLLVRHAQTDAVGRVLAGRSPGWGLNAQGKADAARLALSLSGTPIAGVYSSPRLRTRETAAQIASVTGCIVEDTDALDEVDFGSWNGRGFDGLQADERWDAWNGLRSLAATPGGETMLQVQARAVGFMQTVHAHKNGGAFVLVSHADVLKCMLAYALGSPIDMMQRIDIMPSSLTEIHFDTMAVRVAGVNRLC